MRNCLYLILALFILVPNVWSENLDQEARIQKLEQVIKDQSQKIDELQKKVGAVEPSSDMVQEYANKTDAADANTVVAGYDNGFFIKSGDGNFELFMTGYVQVGLGIFENNSYEHNSFYPNGIYLTFDAYLYKSWHARIQFSLADIGSGDPVAPYASSRFNNESISGITLQDAYIEYLYMPEFQIRIGQTHVPFTMQGQYGSNEGIQIWGEPFMNWSHGRDMGILLNGTLSDMFEYKLGIFNGEGANRLNNSDYMLMAGSIRLYPFKKSDNANTFFHLGVMRTRDNNEHESRDKNAASLFTPWGRQVFDGGFGTDHIRGWKTGVDVAFRFDQNFGKNNLRVEGEFMYTTFERGFKVGDTAATSRLPYLHGYGASFGFSYRANLNPEVEGEGIIPSFVFSYSDIDNKSTDDFVSPSLGNPPGQRAYCYTFGLGYAFNSHISANFNWVMVNLEEKDLYGGPKDRADASDDVEHAWFVQVLCQW